jgi:hemerythrin-like metal-binding protein
MYTVTGHSGSNTRDSAERKLSGKIMDRDHRELSETIKDLQADILVGKDRDRTVRLLRKLEHFARSHFAMEEGMMAATWFPGLAAHSVRHQSMMQDLRAFGSSHSRGGSILGVNLPWFLTQWHTAHIRDEDRKLEQWLNQSDPSDPEESD